MLAHEESRHVSGWFSARRDGFVVAAGAFDGRLFGWDAATLSGRRVDSLIHRDDLAVFDAVAARVLDGDWEQVVQLRLRSRTGRWLRVEATVRGTGNATVLAELVDISARFVSTEGLAMLSETRRLMDDADDVSSAWGAALGRLADRGGFGRWAYWTPAPAADDADDGSSARGVHWRRTPDEPTHPSIATAVATAAASDRWGWTHELADRAPFASSAALIVPVTSGDDVIAVVELSRQQRLIEDSAIAMVVEVAGQLGDGFERRRVDGDLAVERQRFELAFEEAAIGMMLVSPGGVVTRANEACCRFFGRSEVELLALDLESITHPDDLPRERELLQELADGTSAHIQFEQRYQRPDGHFVWGLSTITLVRSENGRPLHHIVQIQDIDDRRTAQLALERTVALFAAAFDGAATGMVLVGLDGDEQSMVAAANARFRQLCADLGHERGLLRFDEFSPGADRWLQEIGRSDVTDSSVCERAIHGPEGERWVRLSAASVNTGEVDHRFVLVHVEDITEQRQAQSELAYNALHDTLTGLPNRTLISERIRHALERSRRTDAHVGVLFIDLDNFKDVNDSLGHHAGDELLREVAHRFAGNIRPVDTAARLGGDEFVILCEDLNTDPAAALRELTDVASRLHASLEGGVDFGDGEGWVTASIGLQVVRGTDHSVATVLGNADVAMYRAKANGRSRTEVFDAAMRRAALERVHIASELRRAIERGQMWCEYQPIVRLTDGLVTGAEALLRWRHPELGQVPPTRFIDVAEESDLIVELGEFVVDAVCGIARSLPRLGYITMNVSARQLAQSDFSDMLLAALHRHRVDPRRIAVELTENVLMDAGGSSLRQLVDLREAGLPIGVDDFGTGFASLTYLRRLPVSFVKIDKSFVDGILDDADDRTIVDGTIGLAHSLGLALVAEGVETADQAVLLAELGCESGQGYLFSRPTADLEQLMSGGRLTHLAVPQA